LEGEIAAEAKGGKKMNIAKCKSDNEVNAIMLILNVTSKVR
jgi:hypothetical protein